MNFSTRSRLNRVLYTKLSPHGTPFAVGLATDSYGNDHTVLACANRFGDLDHLKLLEGQDLELTLTESGLQVKPVSQQPRQVQEHLVAALEAGANENGNQLGIPTINGRESRLELDLPMDPIHPVHATQLPKLSELATTVAHLASELGLATAMWVHLPAD